MSKKGNAKASKKVEHRYEKLANNMAGYHDHIDFRLFDDFNDDAFAYLMKKVKGVNMLDLNETDITNASIALLDNLEYVRELRAKQCRNLDDDCTEDLNKLTDLVFLHLNNTNITIDGLLKLNNLSNLKTLLFSAEDVQSIKEKLLQLKTILPQCEMVINSKPHFINATPVLIHALRELPFKYRLKLKNESLIADWSYRLNNEDEGFIEVEAQGSFPFDTIEWVEIKPIEKVGENKVATEVGYSDKIINLLKVLEFPYMIDGSIFSVYLLNKDI